MSTDRINSFLPRPYWPLQLGIESDIDVESGEHTFTFGLAHPRSMQLVRYTTGGRPTWGVETEATVHSLGGLLGGPLDLAELTNPSWRRTVHRRIEADDLPQLALDSINRLAPVPQPGKIVCIGLNYHDHAEEQNEEPPDAPLLFGKAPTTVTDPGAAIRHPTGVEQLDYEVELGVVIGRTATGVTAADADDYIAGYTAVNDVSARDAQFNDGQWFRGKSYDTFSPMGPTLVTGDAIDPNDLSVECRVNGDTKQHSSTSEFIFDVHELVEYVSRAMTLRPGDVISTGTPGGVGIFRDPPELLEPGDVVEVEVEGIGVLENPVVAGD